jgi:tetratricopeptide (TPR) repeat protein
VEFIAAGGASKGASAPVGGGAKLAMIGGAAAVIAIGFVAILASHGGGGGGHATGTPDPKDLLQHDPNQVDIANLLGHKPDPGVAVNRNDATKPATNVLPAGAMTPASNSSTAGLVSDGDRAYSSGRLVDARADYFRAAQLDANDKAVAAKLHRVEGEILQQIDHHFRAGNSYNDTGRYDDAKREYEAVLLLDPDPNSENYTNAQVRIKEVEQKLQDQQSGLH